MSTPAQASGVRKAAVALLALGDDSLTALFSLLREDEVERVALEIAGMGAVPADLGEQVLSELSTSAGAKNIAAGGLDQARRILSKTLKPDQAQRVLDRVIHSANTVAGFASLERANPEQLSKFFIGEHPQTTALIMAHLNPTSAAKLLEQLPEDLRAEVMLRIANLGDIEPDVLARVSTVIEERLRSLGGSRREQRGGVKAVAQLFNCLERTVSRPVLERLESLDEEVATTIRNLMFVFEDLVHVDDTGIREILNRADKKVMTVALKGASEAIRERFFGNMSKRGGEQLKEEMEVLGAVRLREVEAAQQEVVGVARALEEEGLISTGSGAGEDYVT